MNRRGFLKKYSLIPFVGSLPSVAKAVASESKLVNEEVVKQEFSCVYFVDEKNGNDNNSGLSWSDAFATKERALASCEGRREELICMPSGNSQALTHRNPGQPFITSQAGNGKDKVKLRFRNPEHEHIHEAREWLSEVEEIMNRRYNK